MAFKVCIFNSMFPSNQSHVLGVPKAIINFYELTILLF